MKFTFIKWYLIKSMEIPLGTHKNWYQNSFFFLNWYWFHFFFLALFRNMQVTKPYNVNICFCHSHFRHLNYHDIKDRVIWNNIDIYIYIRHGTFKTTHRVLIDSPGWWFGLPLIYLRTFKVHVSRRLWYLKSKRNGTCIS